MTSETRRVRSPRERQLSAQVELIALEKNGQAVPEGLRELAAGDMNAVVKD